MQASAFLHAFKRRAIKGFALVALLILFPSAAHAACTNPAGSAGDIVYNQDRKVFQGCTGDAWVAFHGAAYTPYAVSFDGVNDHLVTGALTAVADSKSATGSFWVRRTGGIGVQQRIYRATGNDFTIFFRADNTIRIYGRDNSGNNDIIFDSTLAIADSNWHHVLFSFDTNAGNARIYIDGTNVTAGGATVVNDLINFDTTEHRIGADSGPAQLLNADIADFWFDINTYMDLSVAGNRSKFRDSSGNPVFLGTDGSGPTGAVPEVFLSGTPGAWHTNKGTGGGFTLNGALTASSFSTSSLVTGLRSYWKMDDGSGLTAVDSMGVGNGTLNSGATWGTGFSGGALQLDGVNDYVSVANESMYDFTSANSFSITAWVWRNSTSNEDSIWGKANPADNWRGYAFLFEPGSDRLIFHMGGNAGAAIGVSATGTATGRWEHVAVTYNGNGNASGVQLYVNGVAKSKTIYANALAGSVLNNISPLIGNDNAADTCCVFGGRIDELRIYSRVLSPAEVVEAMNYRGKAECMALGDEAYYDDSSESCYFRKAAATTWSVAQTNCAADGGYLAQFPNSTIHSAVVSNLYHQSCWIGGTDAAVDGQWRWSGGPLDGQQFWQGAAGGSITNGLYANWTGGEPNSGAENCANYETGNNWNNTPCANTRCSICQKNIPAGQTECSSPVAAAGSIIYNASARVFQGCTVDGWKALHGKGSGGGGCGSPAGVAGEIVYNSTAKAFQGCTADGWQAFNGKTSTLPSAHKKVFVTTQKWNGSDIGGLAGADAKCASAATSTGLTGTFLAWIATSAADDPESRFTRSSVPYALIDGTIIANDWADLVDGAPFSTNGLAHPINLTETGDLVDGDGDALVKTSVEGNGASNDIDCINWGSTAGTSGSGRTSSAVGDTWTADTLSACMIAAHLYCFQQ